MSSTHTELLIPADIHRLAPQYKVAATALFGLGALTVPLLAAIGTILA